MKTPTYLDKTGVRVACVKTKADIYIGSAYQAPPRSLSWDETQIQSMMIGPKRAGLSLKGWALFGLVAAFCLMWISK